jgi:hypothetical protein
MRIATPTCRVAPRVDATLDKHFSEVDGLMPAAVDL